MSKPDKLLAAGKFAIQLQTLDHESFIELLNRELLHWKRVKKYSTQEMLLKEAIDRLSSADATLQILEDQLIEIKASHGTIDEWGNERS